MANLSITRRCQRHCGYCFAQYELGREAAADMPPEVYETALAFLKRSGFPEVRLLGGEPTEHPQFREYVNRAHELGFRVVIFSGGLVPGSALEFMAALPKDRFSVVLNAADPANDAEALVKRQRKVCRALGSKVMLGVNIRTPDQDPTYLFDWVSEFDSRRAIRVGLAHPIWGGTNDFFRLRGPRVISVIERLAVLGAKIGVNVGFDCGFTPCMFSPKFVDSHTDMFLGCNPDARPPGQGLSNCASSSYIKRDATGLPPISSDDSVGRKTPTALIEAVGMRCNPVVDILPEGDCIACYALSRFHRLPLPPAGTRNDLVSSFERALLPVLPVGVHRECAYCDYREKGMCGGGCRARRALRLRPNAFGPLHAE
jgi:hypothetical protein